MDINSQTGVILPHSHQLAGACYFCLCRPDQVAARRGFVDDIIDPALTRRILCQDLQLLRDKPAKTFPKKHNNIPL